MMRNIHTSLQRKLLAVIALTVVLALLAGCAMSAPADIPYTPEEIQEELDTLDTLQAEREALEEEIEALRAELEALDAEAYEDESDEPYEEYGYDEEYPYEEVDAEETAPEPQEAAVAQVEPAGNTENPVQVTQEQPEPVQQQPAQAQIQQIAAQQTPVAQGGANFVYGTGIFQGLRFQVFYDTVPAGSLARQGGDPNANIYFYENFGRDEGYILIHGRDYGGRLVGVIHNGVGAFEAIRRVDPLPPGEWSLLPSLIREFNALRGLTEAHTVLAEENAAAREREWARQRDPMELIRLINDERARRGLRPFRVCSDLMAFAQIRADEGGLAGGAPHTRPNGDRVRRENWSASNNISTFNTWMNSPGHRAPMMSEPGTWGESVEYIGAGIGSGGSVLIFDSIDITCAITGVRNRNTPLSSIR